jgi:Ca2+-binding RTX toxin-like protein
MLIVGTVFADFLVGTPMADTIYGLDGDDFLDCAAGNDYINAGNGNDRVVGGAGNDYMDGGAGADYMKGGTGNDILRGGLGPDMLFGDLGADRFLYTSVADSMPGAFDRIGDFSSAQFDRIDLAAIDANTGLGGDQPFAYIGAAAFSGVAGELRYAGGFLDGDVNGDALSDFRVHVGVAALGVADFVL